MRARWSPLAFAAVAVLICNGPRPAAADHGDALGISVNTVRKHIRNLYEKLEVHTRSEAVGKALRGGLI